MFVFQRDDYRNWVHSYFLYVLQQHRQYHHLISQLQPDDQ